MADPAEAPRSIAEEETDAIEAQFADLRGERDTLDQLLRKMTILKEEVAAERDELRAVVVNRGEAFVKERLQVKALEADRARLQQQVQEMIDVAGEALATDPENRSIGCVEALAQWSHQLRDDLADLIHLQPVGAHRDCHDLSCNAHREYPRGAKGVCCSCRGRDAAYEALTQLRQALGQLPRYWVWIDRAFPEPMACLGTELSPEGEWVKFEDVQKALTP